MLCHHVLHYQHLRRNNELTKILEHPRRIMNETKFVSCVDFDMLHHLTVRKGGMPLNYNTAKIDKVKERTKLTGCQLFRNFFYL